MLHDADEDKTYDITENVIMGVTGEAGDVPRFAEYITQNVKLYRMRNGYDLSIPAIATFTRKTVAEYLRSQVITLLKLHVYIIYWYFFNYLYFYAYIQVVLLQSRLDNFV